MEEQEQWSVIVQGPTSWSVVAEGDEETMTDVVNLYHDKRPDLDESVRLISPAGARVEVEYAASTLKDELPLEP